MDNFKATSKNMLIELAGKTMIGIAGLLAGVVGIRQLLLSSNDNLLRDYLRVSSLLFLGLALALLLHGILVYLFCCKPKGNSSKTIRFALLSEATSYFLAGFLSWRYIAKSCNLPPIPNAAVTVFCGGIAVLLIGLSIHIRREQAHSFRVQKKPSFPPPEKSSALQ